MLSQVVVAKFSVFVSDTNDERLFFCQEVEVIW